LPPKSFQLFQGVFAPFIQIRDPQAMNWVPLTLMRERLPALQAEPAALAKARTKNNKR
jgi:hypothetical protein